MILLAHSLRMAAEAAERIGAIAVATEAINGMAMSFYIHHGFSQLNREGMHLFLPISAIPRRAERRAEID